MDRNTFALVFCASAIGLSTGLYVFIYPLFLSDIGISLIEMGMVFSIASLSMAILGFIFGWLSDLSGRKQIYSFSILLECIATTVTPYLRRMWEMSIVKIFRDADESIRAGLQPALMYDYTKKGFARLLGTTQGVLSLMQAVGTFISAALLVDFGFNGAFLISGLAAFIALAIFVLGFTEKPVDKKPATVQGLRNAFTGVRDVSRNLKLLSATNLFFTMGNQISHSFMMPLFFTIKFDAPLATVALIESLHRASIGLPSILVAQGVFGGPNMNQQRLKTIAALSLVFQGSMIVITGLSQNFYIAVFGWLAHDILGPPFRNPAQGTLVQIFSTDTTRGRDNNVMSAFGKIGGIIGPALSGYLAAMYLSLPVIASGIIVLASPIFYLAIKDSQVDAS